MKGKLICFLISVLMTSLLSGCLSSVPKQVRAWQETVAQADKMPNVDRRTHVEAYFNLARWDEENGRFDEAIVNFEKGLAVDSARPLEQFHLAELYQKKGRMEEAKASYLVVARNAADSELKVKAQKALQAFGEEIPLEKKGEGFAPRMEYTLYLLPMGNTNGKILSCLQEGLKQKMHIDVKTLERMPLPENVRKRNFGDRYLQNLSKEIRSQMGEDRLQLVCRSYRIDPRRLNESAVQVEFLRVVLKENPEDLRNFETEYQKYRSEFQYNVKDLLKCVEEKYNNYLKEPKTLGILGVTDRDIFENDYNFLFGWARPHLGVMSYRRFTAEFNGEPKNLQKVADRALKQGLSSAGYILGVKRCTDPDCARAYPHSLKEHDHKSTELCPQCRKRLEEALKRLP